MRPKPDWPARSAAQLRRRYRRRRPRPTLAERAPPRRSFSCAAASMPPTVQGRYPRRRLDDPGERVRIENSRHRGSGIASACPDVVFGASACNVSDRSDENQRRNPLRLSSISSRPRATRSCLRARSCRATIRRCCSRTRAWCSSRTCFSAARSCRTCARPTCSAACAPAASTTISIRSATPRGITRSSRCSATGRSATTSSARRSSGRGNC